MSSLRAMLWMFVAAYLVAVSAAPAHAQSPEPADEAETSAEAEAEAEAEAKVEAVAERPATTTEPADADPPAPALERARAHFNLGVEFYRERNFRAALLEFQRAYAEAPHYKLLYNLGQASRELQEYASAIDYFTGYLRAESAEISAERRAEVEQAIRQLESRLAHVTIVSNQEGAELYVDDTLVGQVPLQSPVRVGAGRHRFLAISPGLQPVERIVDVAAGDERQVDLEFQERKLDVAPVTAARPPLNVSGTERSSNTMTYVLGATTALLGAGAITMSVVTGMAQQNYRNELDVETTAARLDRMRDRAKRRALVTDVLWGTTLLSGIVTTIWVLARSGGESDAPAHAQGRVNVGLGPSGIAVDGTF